MPRCCCWRFSLSTFGWCCCCCTVPTSKEKLPLLDVKKRIPKSFDGIHVNEIFVPKSYMLSKNKSPKQSRIRVVTISDTHMHHMSYNMPPAEVLIIAGDFTNWRTTNSNLNDVIKWIASLKQYTYKVIIGGNHEVGLNKKTKEETIKIFKNKCNAIYLQDTFIELFGLKFFGTPWHPKRGCFFHAEAFAKPVKELKNIFNNIPDDTDILITHVPPYGVNDAETAGHIGSYSLLNNIVNRVKPILNVFGHVHGANGVTHLKGSDTVFVNTATVLNVFDFVFEQDDGQYNSPLVINNNNDTDDYKVEDGDPI